MPSPRASIPGIPSGGMPWLEVIVIEVDEVKKIAHVIDNFGESHRVRTDILRAKGPAPEVGERWILDRALGHWTFAAYKGTAVIGAGVHEHPELEHAHPYSPLTHSHPGGGGGFRPGTIVVAASDASPRWLGVADFVCPGGDDTGVFQTIADELADTYGGTVICSDGEFYIDEVICGYPIKFEGQGRGSTYMRGVGGNGSVMFTFPFGYACGFEHIGFAGTSGVTCIRINGGGEIHVHRCTFDAIHCAVDVPNGTQRLWITENVFNGVGGEYFGGPGTKAAVWLGYTTEAFIRGNVFEFCDENITLLECDRVHVYDNDMNSTIKNGMLLDSCGNCKVHDNDLGGPGGGYSYNSVLYDGIRLLNTWASSVQGNTVRGKRGATNHWGRHHVYLDAACGENNVSGNDLRYPNTTSPFAAFMDLGTDTQTLGGNAL